MTFKWLKKRESFGKYEENRAEIIEKCSVYYIPCDKIRSNAMRSRSDFNEDEIVLLAYSIKKYGIIEPLCVRCTEGEDSYLYELICGERRLRAAKLLGLYAVPCIIEEASEAFSAEMSLCENLFRSKLNCFEVAFALKRISDFSSEPIEDIASRLSMSESDAIRKLRLLDFGFDERQAILNSFINEDVAYEILQIPEKERRFKAIDTIASSSMSDSAAICYIDSLRKAENTRQDIEKNALPRDVSSALSGISRRIGFLNRHGKRSEMKVLHDRESLEIKISIKL